MGLLHLRLLTAPLYPPSTIRMCRQPPPSKPPQPSGKPSASSATAAASTSLPAPLPTKRALTPAPAASPSPTPTLIPASASSTSSPSTAHPPCWLPHHSPKRPQPLTYTSITTRHFNSTANATQQQQQPNLQPFNYYAPPSNPTAAPIIPRLHLPSNSLLTSTTARSIKAFATASYLIITCWQSTA